jgi:hypothetical protein
VHEERRALSGLALEFVMGKAVGYFLLIAGVGSGAYAVMPDTKLAKLGTNTPSVMASAAQAVLAVRTDAATTAGAKLQTATAPMAPAPQLAVRPVTAGTQAIAPGSQGNIVAPAKSADTPEQQPRPVAAPVSGKTEDAARSQLARDIQRELKRVGCYSGDVNGEWTGGSRAAMNQFIERINATLPTDQPDHILKTLVQGHPGNACGKTCPAGQGLSNEGRCQPSAILAQQTTPRRPVSRGTVPSRDADERPAVALAAKAKPAGWDTKVVAVTPPAASTAPAPVTAAAVPAPAAVALAPRGETPDGRMAVGGPASGSANDRDAIALSAVAPIVTGSLPAAKPAVPRVAAIPAPKGDADAEDRQAAARADERRPQRLEPDRRLIPPQNVYVVPRPRYVAAPQYYYPPQQVYRAPARERTNFGPRIFSQMQRDGR